MPKRGPTDNDHPTPPADGDVEVVNAAGERKPASLPQRVKDKVRDTLTGTDPLPTWQPGELADDGAEPDRAAAFEQTRRAALADADQTLVVGNGDVAAGDQPPANVLATYRRQYRANNIRIAEQAHRHTVQRVEMDEQARRRVLDISHLFALTAIGNEADAALASDGWAVVPQRLIDAFAAEVAGWQTDREVSGP
jgi:hypothetical protein